MSPWRNPQSLASLAFVFAVTVLAGPAFAQVTGTPADTAPGAPSAPPTQPGAPQTSASQPSAPEPGSPAPYNSIPALRRDLAVSAFAQFSSSTVGNFIRNDTTGSGGALLSYRYTYKPWLGYEVNYGFTRYTDSYYFGVVRVPHNVHEFSLAYLLQGPKFSGFTPFLTLGGGALVFAPSANATGSYGVDAKRMFVYGIGVQRSIVNDHWGVRVQYRGLKYGIPAYGQLSLNTHRGRTSYEPGIGVYYRF